MSGTLVGQTESQGANHRPGGVVQAAGSSVSQASAGPTSARATTHTTGTAPIASPAESARRRQLLEAALDVFLRFGYRKASMDEVARAARMSRQGLYLHFSGKEALFRAVVQHALGAAFRAASARLADPSLPVRDRLAGAFDEWVGRYVGTLGAGVSDLGDATDTLAAPLMREYGERFVDLLAKFMRSSGMVAAYKPAGLTGRQLAETLHATARGLKYESASREEFLECIGRAMRAFCLPLGGRA